MNYSNDLIIIDRFKQKKHDPEIQKAFEIAKVGPDKGILLLDDSIEIPNYYGLFLPKCLYQYSNWDNVFNTAISYDGDFNLQCRYYIAISGRVNRIRKKYPAFFLYVLAHELGHARTFLSNHKIHIFSCLLKEFFGEASCLKINPWEYPDEIQYDQFGLYIVEKMLLQKNLESEIFQLMNDKIFNNDSLESLLNLESSDTLDGLHDKLIKFSIEYKNNLKMLWQEDVNENGSYTLASKINDFETLFVSKGSDLR